MTARYPMEEIETALDVADIARDLVALWQAPNIKGLPRAERNAAIESTRERLIKAVEDWNVIRAEETKP
jgi:hypothetical protein